MAAIITTIKITIATKISILYNSNLFYVKYGEELRVEYSIQ
jgi:hypothetical protein